MQCCSPGINGGGGWGIFNALFGWQNSATYGSVISYNLYWIVVIIVFLLMRFKETRGRYPFMKAKAGAIGKTGSRSGSSSEEEGAIVKEKANGETGATSNIKSVKG